MPGRGPHACQSDQDRLFQPGAQVRLIDCGHGHGTPQRLGRKGNNFNENSVITAHEGLRTQKQRRPNTGPPQPPKVKREPFATHSGKKLPQAETGPPTHSAPKTKRGPPTIQVKSRDLISHPHTKLKKLEPRAQTLPQVHKWLCLDKAITQIPVTPTWDVTEKWIKMARCSKLTTYVSIRQNVLRPILQQYLSPRHGHRHSQQNGIMWAELRDHHWLNNPLFGLQDRTKKMEEMLLQTSPN